MRRTIAHWAAPALLVLAAASVAAAVTPTHPYRITPTRACLTRHGAHLKPRSDKQLEPNQLEWVLPHSGTGTKARTIVMRFLGNPTKAVEYQRITQHTFSVEGFSDAWIQRHLTRRKNVVIEKDNVSYGLTKRELATIGGCLRR
jgi:hypothetical protein